MNTALILEKEVWSRVRVSPLSLPGDLRRKPTPVSSLLSKRVLQQITKLFFSSFTSHPFLQPRSTIVALSISSSISISSFLTLVYYSPVRRHPFNPPLTSCSSLLPDYSALSGLFRFLSSTYLLLSFSFSFLSLSLTFSLALSWAQKRRILMDASGCSFLFCLRVGPLLFTYFRSSVPLGSLSPGWLFPVMSKPANRPSLSHAGIESTHACKQARPSQFSTFVTHPTLNVRGWMRRQSALWWP